MGLLFLQLGCQAGDQDLGSQLKMGDVAGHKPYSPLFDCVLLGTWDQGAGPSLPAVPGLDTGHVQQSHYGPGLTGNFFAVSQVPRCQPVQWL